MPLRLLHRSVILNFAASAAAPPPVAQTMAWKVWIWVRYLGTKESTDVGHQKKSQVCHLPVARHVLTYQQLVTLLGINLELLE
jgi:hypothetical protein